MGFSDHGQLQHYLPPQPPPVHYSVYACTDDELCSFTETPDFFRSVLFAYQIPSDEVLAAIVRAAARARAAQGQDRAYLVRAGREIASLLKDDYDRLNAILRRIRP